TDVGGNRECLTGPDGLVGSLVPAADAEALAAAIGTLLADRAARDRLALRAARRAERVFGLDRMLEQTENLYLRLLERSR
ncbi:MAG: hypothetical protein JSV80_11710, partial [Acidobacteriota bacterium]